jgi:hypothetical protein
LAIFITLHYAIALAGIERSPGTKRYLGVKQDLIHPRNDEIKLRVVVWTDVSV